MRANSLLLTVLLLLVSYFSFSQAKLEETQKKISQQHALLIKKNDAIIAGSSKDMKKSVEELAALFEQAKKDYADLEKKLTPAQKEKAKADHDAIKKNYDQAFTHLKTMQSESAKQKPDVNKIKSQAKMMNGQIKAAENQVEKMKKALAK